MFDEVNLLPMSVKSVREKVAAFLADNGLRPAPVDYYAAIQDEDDNILAGGGLSGNVIKGVAVSGKARSAGYTNKLISYLINLAHQLGFDSVKVYTKPSNLGIFKSLGFSLLAQAPEAILMENGKGELGKYVKYLEGLRRPGRNGVIVMNANPFTLGHKYLVSQAAAKVDNLYVIVVREDRSQFPYAERKAMIEYGCSSLRNVIVCEGSDYVISDATFPTYFLKRLEDSTDTQIALDLDLFVRHVAPALGAVVRFAGDERVDALTDRYNVLMGKILPMRGIEFEVVARLMSGSKPVSASRVREAIESENLSDAIALCPSTTVPYLLSECAVRAMRKELDATPKPGLVDMDHNGAHTDMDYSLMSLSITALRPFLTALACQAFAAGADPDYVRDTGIRAERAMKDATGGVNTHKGALFCLGISVAAAADCFRRDGRIEANAVRMSVRRIAEAVPAAQDTHGADVTKKYKASGALSQARYAWPALFSDWLPFYRGLEGDPWQMQKTLLRIMTVLDDTNIMYRKGAERAEEVKKEARRLLTRFTPESLRKMDEKFVEEGISPGGSADMLSLTIFYNTITN